MKLKKVIRNKWVLIMILAALLVGGYLWYQSQRKAVYAQNETYTVKKSNVRETLSLTGRIDADQKATIRFLTSGRLTWVGVKEGDIVSKNQALASLDQRELQKQFQKSLNMYKITRNSFDQALKDNEDWGAYEPEVADKMRRLVDTAQANLNNSVIDVELQQLASEYSIIYSPIDGLVTSAESPFPGTNITAAQVAFEIVNPSTIFFSASADQAEVVKLAQGLQGSIIFDSFPEEEVQGTIQRISFMPKTDEIGTVYEVRVSLLDPSLLARLRLGMTGDITFTLKERDDVPVIPSEFLQIDEEGNNFVYKLVDQNVTEVPVKIGLDSGEFIEIINGVVPGDVLVSEIK
jgi:RND family efflux transporter MFP subunit